MATEQYPKVYLYRRIVQAKLFIDNHYRDNIDLEQISDEAYFSKFHFIRLFKKIYGKTPNKYLITVRINKAKTLLENATSVSEVCSAVGFESLSTFCGLFKRMVGVTPSTYLTKHQKVKTHMITSPMHYVPGCFAEKNGWTKKIAILEKP